VLKNEYRVNRKNGQRQKKRLGNKIVNIDARQTTEEINAQVLEILGE